MRQFASLRLVLMWRTGIVICVHRTRSLKTKQVIEQQRLHGTTLSITDQADVMEAMYMVTVCLKVANCCWLRP